MPRKSVVTTDSTLTRSKRRRDAIFAGLHACVIEHGYSSTTLADIARAAEMSPSHLLYYFSDKADILAQYFSDVSERIKARLFEFRSGDSFEKIDHLAKFFFSSRGLSRSEIGMMLECFGAAVHDEKLKQYKSGLDRACKDFLNELFVELGGNASSSSDATEVAYALLVGLRTAVYFDAKLGVEDAHRIFRNHMISLAQEISRGRSVAVTSGRDGSWQR